MAAIVEPRSDGVFESPLGPVDWSRIPWTTMRSFMQHTFRDKHPDQCMIEAATDIKMTYRQCFDAAEKVASQLASDGLSGKKIVHVVRENSLKWVVALMACHLSDFVVCGTHPVSPWPELQRNITKTCSTVLVITESCYEKLKSEIASPFLEAIYVMKDGLSGCGYEVQFTRMSVSQEAVPAYDPELLSGVCQMLFSSGTTGPPKAITLSSRSVIAVTVISNYPGVTSIDESSIFLVAHPMAHFGGQNFSFLVPAFAGATLVVTDYPGSEGMLKLAEKYRMTHVLAVPPVLNFLAKFKDLGKYDMSSIRYITTGGTSPSIESIRELIRRSNNHDLKVKVVYGQTESNGVWTSTNDFYDSSLESIGTAFPGFEYKIIDIENGTAITTPRVEGELVVKSALDCTKYFLDEEKSKESVTADGFLKTGDVVYLDERNNVFVSGRIKDVIKYRGFTISPTEIEDILMAHPQVLDCAVVGRPSPEHGEIPVAFVVTSEGREELKGELLQLVAARVAERKKIREVHFIHAIPRVPNGKILKRLLRDKFEP